MKKVLFFLLVAAPIFCMGQIVDGVALSKRTDIQYVQLITTARAFKSPWLSVDYGQKFSPDKETVISSESGQVLKFNGILEMANYFYSKGWELSEAFVAANDSGVTYHWILSRKKT